MKLTKAIIVICVCIISSCNSYLPHEASQIDQRTVHVWVERECPSDIDKKRVGPLVAALGGILLSNVVSGIVGIPGAALSAAVEADKNGYTAAGISARYYYEKQGKNKPDIPQCYIVAYVKPTDKETSWCENEGFKSSVGKTCEDGRALLISLQKEKPHPQKLDVPDFYTEIRLDPSEYPNIALPKIVALYYPKSLLQPISKDPRTITISLKTSSLGQKKTLRSATATPDTSNKEASKDDGIKIIISGVIPGEKISVDNLAVQTGWVNLPVVDLPQNNLQPKNWQRYSPVNIISTVHEVGEPSAFLAAFAKAFSGSSGEYSKAVSSSVFPAATK